MAKRKKKSPTVWRGTRLKNTTSDVMDLCLTAIRLDNVPSQIHESTILIKAGWGEKGQWGDFDAAFKATISK